MCKNWFGGSSRKQAAAIAEQTRIQAEIAAKQAEAEKKRQKTADAALKLQKKNEAFQREQAKKQEERQAKLDEIAARPDPVTVAPPPPPPAVVTNGQSTDSDFNVEEDEDNVDTRRKGRRSLRIDLSGPSNAGGTGLNVPVG